jgi:GNAT superfamily N-acetyltransferase
VQSFWGQLHIKYLFVEKHYRDQGLARELMNHAIEFGKVGMICRIDGCRSTKEQVLQELQHIWIDPQTLSKDQCSSLLWKYKQTYINGLRNE